MLAVPTTNGVVDNEQRNNQLTLDVGVLANHHQAATVSVNEHHLLRVSNQRSTTTTASTHHLHVPGQSDSFRSRKLSVSSFFRPLIGSPRPKRRSVRSSASQRLQCHLIEQRFYKVECIQFIPTPDDNTICQCGRTKCAHGVPPPSTFSRRASVVQDTRAVSAVPQTQAASGTTASATKDREPSWTTKHCTASSSTDAYGTIEFQGSAHPRKAQYVRLAHDSHASDIMELFDKTWNLPEATLVITVHGGHMNFSLNSKVSSSFRKGLLKAAKTTGAWIITNGLDMGVVPHVANALSDSFSRSRSRITSIGIAPWGIVQNRDALVGKEHTVNYHPKAYAPKNENIVLNDKHTYFLLVDDGTINKPGCDIGLRRDLEDYMTKNKSLGSGRQRTVPVVCVVLEGSQGTVRTVLDYVNSDPPVPVVIIDGSGRCADVLAFCHYHATEDGKIRADMRDSCLEKVMLTFRMELPVAEHTLEEIDLVLKHKKLITIFRVGEDSTQDVDHAILTALLKGQKLTPADQLSLALAWDRPDIARSDIFVLGQEWSVSALYHAMFEALSNDRVEFVKLLLENGVDMQKFLNIYRLEELYNTDKGPENTLRYIIRDVLNKFTPGKDKYYLPDVGLLIEKLMGGGYQSIYTSGKFKTDCEAVRQKHKDDMIVQMSERSSALHSSQSASSMSTSVNSELWYPWGSSPFAYRRLLTIRHKEHPWKDRRRPAHRSTRTDKNERREASKLRSRMHSPRFESESAAVDKWYPWGDSPFHHRKRVFEAPIKRYDTKASLAHARQSESHTVAESPQTATEHKFAYPFGELLKWAVLTKRQAMAKLMWQHGEEAMAKALVACKLYKSLAHEAADDYLELEICEQLRRNAEEFRKMSLDILEQCYQTDDDRTLQLLTYELKDWGRQTCLSLAVIANHKEFLAHPCCQILLADLWHGGLRIRRHSNVKVLLGLAFFPFIMFLEFKTKRELQNQAQTAAEHREATASSGESSVSSSSEGSELESEDETDLEKQNNADNRSLNVSVRNPLRRIFTRKRGNEECNNSNGMSLVSFTRRSRTTKRSQKNSKTLPNKPMIRVGSVEERMSNTGLFGTVALHNPDSNGSPALSVGHTTVDKRLRLSRRYSEFYTAPITTFWSYSMSYVVFLVALTYMCLVRTPLHPSAVEMYCVANVITIGLELIRRMIFTEPKSLVKKVQVFFRKHWNGLTLLAVVMFLCAFALRFSNGRRGTARVLYTVTSVLWWLRLLQFLAVHNRLGPYITMVGKMVVQMIYIVTILTVVLISFGLVRQSITYPDEDWDWMLVRNIFYKPYFMLYGEVYAGEIAPCGDKGELCVEGQWIVPALMAAFLLVANILLINLLIAVFNNVYYQMDSLSHQMWKFQRYEQVMDYEQSPFLPPPFTLLCHVWQMYKWCRGIQRRTGVRQDRNSGKHYMFDFALKLFLDQPQIEELHDFEEECMEDLSRKKIFEKASSNDERLRLAQEKIEFLQMGQHDLLQKVAEHSTAQRKMDADMETMKRHLQAFLDIDQESTASESTPPLVSEVTPGPSNNIPVIGVVPTTAVVQPISNDTGTAPNSTNTGASIVQPNSTTVTTTNNTKTGTTTNITNTGTTTNITNTCTAPNCTCIKIVTTPNITNTVSAPIIAGADQTDRSVTRSEENLPTKILSTTPATTSPGHDTDTPLARPLTGSGGTGLNARHRFRTQTSVDGAGLHHAQHQHHILRKTSCLTPSSLHATPGSTLDLLEALQRERGMSVSGGRTQSTSSDNASGLYAGLPSTSRLSTDNQELFMCATGEQRAKKSYLDKMNETAKKHEEMNSQITGQLLGNRIKRQSTSVDQSQPTVDHDADMQAFLERMADETPTATEQINASVEAAAPVASPVLPPPTHVPELVSQSMSSAEETSPMSTLPGNDQSTPSVQTERISATQPQPAFNVATLTQNTDTPIWQGARPCVRRSGTVSDPDHTAKGGSGSPSVTPEHVLVPGRAAPSIVLSGSNEFSSDAADHNQSKHTKSKRRRKTKKGTT